MGDVLNILFSPVFELCFVTGAYGNSVRGFVPMVLYPPSGAAEEPGGPCMGENGFGSFCRNKRTSARGDDTPHNYST